MDDDTAATDLDATDEADGSSTTTPDVTTTRTIDGEGTDETEESSTTSAATTTATESTRTIETGTSDDETSEATTSITTPETTTTPAASTTPAGTTESEEPGTEEGSTSPSATTPAATTTTPPKVPVECKYPLKKVYKKGSGDIVINTNNNETGIDYYSNTPQLCSVNKDNGTITINTAEVTDGVVKCEIICAKEGYNNAKGNFLYEVAEYKPTLDKLLTTFPYRIYPNEEFNATVVLKYPLILDLPDNEKTKEKLTLKLSVTTAGYSLVNEQNELSVDGDTYFNYEGVNVTTTKAEDGLISFKFTNETASPDYTFVYENVKIANVTAAAGCQPELRDGMGLCCEEKDAKDGSMCKNLTSVLTFVNKVDNDLYEAYTELVNAMFSATNYLYSTKLETVNKKKILIPLNIEKSRLRQLQQNPQTISLGDYDFAKSLLSVLECTTEEEVEEKIKLLPPEVQQQVEAAEITSKLKTEVQKVAEKAVETGNTIDYTVGVTSDFDINVEDYEETPEPPTQEPSIPGSGSSKEDPWAKKYWYVILIIVLVVVIILVIVGVVAYMNINKSMKQSKQQKTEKIMESKVEIEQVKQENKVTEDDIYKPFSYEVIMEGYLLKEGRDRIVDKWQRRYCVLYFEPAALRIYDSMVPSYYGKVYIEEKQNIPLTCYSGVDYSDGASDFTLILKINESNLKTFEPGDVERRVHFKVEGENVEHIAKKWVECFRDFKNQKPKTGEAWTQPVLMDNVEGRYATSTETQLYERNMTALERAQQRRKEIRKMTPKHPY